MHTLHSQDYVCEKQNLRLSSFNCFLKLSTQNVNPENLFQKKNVRILVTSTVYNKNSTENKIKWNNNKQLPENSKKFNESKWIGKQSQNVKSN